MSCDSQTMESLPERDVHSQYPVGARDIHDKTEVGEEREVEKETEDENVIEETQQESDRPVQLTVQAPRNTIHLQTGPRAASKTPLVRRGSVGSAAVSTRGFSETPVLPTSQVYTTRDAAASMLSETPLLPTSQIGIAADISAQMRGSSEPGLADSLATAATSSTSGQCLQPRPSAVSPPRAATFTASVQVLERLEHVPQPSERALQPSERVLQPSERVLQSSERVLQSSERVLQPSERVLQPSEKAASPQRGGSIFKRKHDELDENEMQDDRCPPKISRLSNLLLLAKKKDDILAEVSAHSDIYIWHGRVWRVCVCVCGVRVCGGALHTPYT